MIINNHIRFVAARKMLTGSKIRSPWKPTATPTKRDREYYKMFLNKERNLMSVKYPFLTPQQIARRVKSTWQAMTVDKKKKVILQLSVSQAPRKSPPKTKAQVQNPNEDSLLQHTLVDSEDSTPHVPVETPIHTFRFRKMKKLPVGEVTKSVAAMDSILIERNKRAKKCQQRVSFCIDDDGRESPTSADKGSCNGEMDSLTAFAVETKECPDNNQLFSAGQEGEYSSGNLRRNNPYDVATVKEKMKKENMPAKTRKRSSCGQEGGNMNAQLVSPFQETLHSPLSTQRSRRTNVKSAKRTSVVVPSRENTTSDSELANPVIVSTGKLLRRSPRIKLMESSAVSCATVGQAKAESDVKVGQKRISDGEVHGNNSAVDGAKERQSVYGFNRERHTNGYVKKSNDTDVYDVESDFNRKELYENEPTHGMEDDTSRLQLDCKDRFQKRISFEQKVLPMEVCEQYYDIDSEINRVELGGDYIGDTIGAKSVKRKSSLSKNAAGHGFNVNNNNDNKDIVILDETPCDTDSDDDVEGKVEQMQCMLRKCDAVVHLNRNNKISKIVPKGGYDSQSSDELLPKTKCTGNLQAAAVAVNNGDNVISFCSDQDSSFHSESFEQPFQYGSVSSEPEPIDVLHNDGCPAFEGTTDMKTPVDQIIPSPTFSSLSLTSFGSVEPSPMSSQASFPLSLSGVSTLSSIRSNKSSSIEYVHEEQGKTEDLVDGKEDRDNDADDIFEADEDQNSDCEETTCTDKVDDNLFESKESCAQPQQKVISHLFRRITPEKNEATKANSQRRVLASCSVEGEANFSQLFTDDGIFL
ncbi:uncharacterized protein [Ptychodera flava]|uniref:uncharacterized protein n=1 Tax=Ptychodera flava TaxID=63121 RepID=UPI00396A7671